MLVCIFYMCVCMHMCERGLLVGYSLYITVCVDVCYSMFVRLFVFLFFFDGQSDCIVGCSLIVPGYF